MGWLILNFLLISPFTLPIFLLDQQLWFSIDFQKIGLICAMKMQGASLLFLVKNCFKRVVRSFSSERSSTTSGNELEVLTALAVYGATSAYTLNATFFQESHSDA